jgi:hypothetical protein
MVLSDMLVSRPIPLPGLATAMVTTMSVIVALALIRIRLDMRTCSSVWWVWVLYRRGEWLLGRRWVDSSGRQVDSTRWLLVVVFKPVGPFPSPSFSSHSFSIQCMFHPLSSLDTFDGWCNVVIVNHVSLAPSLPLLPEMWLFPWRFQFLCVAMIILSFASSLS